jgi:hypothetical protein
VTVVELDELGPAVERELTLAQGQSLARCGIVTATPSPYWHGTWLIGPAGKVGAVRIGDI